CWRFSKTHRAIASPLAVGCSTKFSLGRSTELKGSLTASMVMSSAKKSGSTTKRPGLSTRSFAAPGPGSTWTATSPRLMRKEAAISTSFAVLKVAASVAAPLVFSIKAARSSETAGSPPADCKRSRTRAIAPSPFTAWISMAPSFRRSTAAIRPLLRMASPLKASVMPRMAIQSFFAHGSTAATGVPVSQTAMPVRPFVSPAPKLASGSKKDIVSAETNDQRMVHLLSWGRPDEPRVVSLLYRTGSFAQMHFGASGGESMRYTRYRRRRNLCKPRDERSDSRGYLDGVPTMRFILPMLMCFVFPLALCAQDKKDRKPGDEMIEKYLGAETYKLVRKFLAG